MGVLPLQFQEGDSAQSLGLTGEETYSIIGLESTDDVPEQAVVRVEGGEGGPREITVTVRIDTPAEAAYYRHGGILQYVLRQLLTA
jgi:aconitate hydratase